MPERHPSSTRRSCPACGSTGERERLHRQRLIEGPLGDGYDVVVCARCGAGFADGIPSQAELDSYYAERSKYTYGHAGGMESPYDRKRFEAIADQVIPHLRAPDAQILDIGCATGGLLNVIRERGFPQVLGSDPSPACAETAQRLHRVPVRTAMLGEHVSWTERFDAVLLVGVLEHLHDLTTSLEIVARLLKPQGFLYCAQPDVEAFAECRNAPYQQFSTEHFNFFSVKSLARAMAGAGLRPAASWRWMVEWREGITDSVASGVYVRAPGGSAPASAAAFDDVTRPALLHYLQCCREQDQPNQQLMADLAASGEPLLVWGTGTFVRRLLATTRLAEANILAFVESSPLRPGQQLVGRPILAPADLRDSTAPILVASITFAEEITRLIRGQFGLSNRLILMP